MYFFRRRRSTDGGRRTAVGSLRSLSLHFSLFSLFLFSPSLSSSSFFPLSLFTARNVSLPYSPIVLKVRNIRKISCFLLVVCSSSVCPKQTYHLAHFPPNAPLCCLSPPCPFAFPPSKSSVELLSD